MEVKALRLISLLRLISRPIPKPAIQKTERQYGISLPQYLLLTYIEQQETILPPMDLLPAKQHGQKSSHPFNVHAFSKTIRHTR